MSGPGARRRTGRGGPDEGRRGVAPVRAFPKSGWAHDESEHDACAIIANVKKDGRASHGNVKRTLEALAQMGHRTGEIEGEGDGAGLQTDIPRERWARRLEAEGFRARLTTRSQFVVAHIMIPHEHRADAERVKQHALGLFEATNLEVLIAEPARVRPEALGPLARAAEPEFWQIAALPRTARGLSDKNIFRLTLRLERELPVHIASLSPNSVIYKVRGDAETLRRYFPELSHPDFKSARDGALRRALEKFCPGLAGVRLLDYKVRVPSGSLNGPARLVRVLRLRSNVEY